MFTDQLIYVCRIYVTFGFSLVYIHFLHINILFQTTECGVVSEYLGSDGPTVSVDVIKSGFPGTKH